MLEAMRLKHRERQPGPATRAAIDDHVPGFVRRQLRDSRLELRSRDEGGRATRRHFKTKVTLRRTRYSEMVPLSTIAS